MAKAGAATQEELPEVRRKQQALERAWEDGKLAVRFETFNARPVKNDKKQVGLVFALPLSKEIAARLPNQVAAAFKDISRTGSGIDEISIESGVWPAQNWSFFEFPERKGASYALMAAAPENLKLWKEKKSKAVLLEFTLAADAHKDTFEFMPQFGNELWMSFEEAQLTLEEQEEKGQAAGA